jgi:outer membrane protein assembly factor BamB
MKSLARKVMDLAEQQGLLDGKAIAELRKQVAESKFVVTPEAIAKVLVDHGHLTPFQARKLVSQAQGDEPDPVEQRVAEKPKPAAPRRPVEDLTFADPADRPLPSARAEIEGTDITEPQPRPAAPSAKKKPTSKPVAPSARGPDLAAHTKPREEPRPTIQQPIEGSTAEEFVDLEPVRTPPPSRGNRWKSDPEELSETVELSPIDLSAPGPASPAADLVPIDDLFGPEPLPAAVPAAGKRPTSTPGHTPLVPLGSSDLLSPLSPLSPLTPLQPIPARRPLKNVWDSPLILIGGGALGVIFVVFALLFYALTRGSAAEMFSKAEEEYQSGAYSNALGIYEQFLKQYPDDPSASLARVRRGMATLRQVADDGKNPRLGLDTAKQVLPEIEKEEKFSEARSELAAILPDIADGFATQATAATDAEKKSELVRLAGEALALVNNPAYLPASLRKDRETHILRIVDKLRAAERGIQQEKELVATIEQIAAAAERGNAAAGYQLQSDLLRTYPGLATHLELIAAVRKIGEKERQLVSTSAGGPEPITIDYEPTSDAIVITFREQTPPPGASVQPVFVLVEGAIYGLDSQTGQVLWRRFVGYETLNQPTPIGAGNTTDVLFIDGRQDELVRLKGASGQLVWRQQLAGASFGPVVSGNRAYVTTRKGLVMAFDVANGQIAASAQLPQGAETAPAVRQSRLYQVGEHSTLFVHDANALTCSETVYLGHRAGEMLVPPIAVLDHVLVIRSPTDEYSEIQLVGQDAKSKRLGPLGKAQRLKGRITTPPAASAARVAVVTDLGQVSVFDVDQAGDLRLVAALDTTESSPRDVYCVMDRNNRLWLANRRAESFEISSSLSQLSRKWTQNHDDTFLGPLRLVGDMLVQVRRRSEVAGILVEACKASTSGEPVWTMHVAAPIAALAASDGRKAVDCVTAEGRLYSLDDKQISERRAEGARFSPRKAGIEIFDQMGVSADGQTLVWTDAGGSARAYVYDVKSGGEPVAISLPAAPAAAAAPLGAEIIAALTDGTVALISRDANAAKAAPFMPPLMPDALPLWTRPAVLADGKTFVISDGRSAVYAVTKRDGGKPSLSPVGETKTADAVISPLVLAGTVAMGVVHQQTTDALGGFDSRGSAVFEPVPLEGRVQLGPFAVGGLVFVYAEPDGLICCGSDGRIRWQHPPERGALAGAPVACDNGDLLVAYQSGEVCRVDAASGNVVAQHEIGEPLLGPACILGAHAFVAGSDGVVHRIVVPRKP